MLRSKGEHSFPVEASLDELLSDPIAEMIMSADGLTREEVEATFTRAAELLAKERHAA